VRRIALEDGSAVTLGAGTRLLRAFSATERRIVMTAGEAFFEVAQDPLRPFVVVARDLTVRAVTTAFNLRMLDGLPLAVAVERGRVSVALAGLRTPTVLEANMRLDLPGDAAPARATVVMMEPDALQRTLAWRDGMLAFEGDALAAVAAQFDRYGPVRIEIADPSLAREPITGLFAANDPRGFARTAAASLGARVETDGNVVRLRRTGPPRE
jgi:transmembrane sensor